MNCQSIRTDGRLGANSGSRIVAYVSLMLFAALAHSSREAHARDDSGGIAPAPLATYRGDARRRGITTRAFRLPLVRQWQRRLPPAQPAWPGRSPKVAFDWGLVPILDGQRVLVASSARGAVDAFDVRTGAKRWTAYADGPVRFAPLVVGDRVYFVSDDGDLHCVHAETGRHLWRAAGKPHGRLVLGNEHLISAWPARGAPVYHKGRIAFAAGIFPWMGIFIRCVDAATGREIWCNSAEGERYLVQQHNSPAFAGIAPQGYLATDGEMLLVPGGLTVPGGFDFATGRFRHFDPSRRTLGKDAGGYEVAMGEGWYVNNGGWYQLESGEPISKFASDVIIADGEVLSVADGHLIARGKTPTQSTQKVTDRRGRVREVTSTHLPEKWRARLPDGTWTLRAVADRQFVLSQGNRLVLCERDGERLKVSWETQCSSDVFSVDCRDGFLAVTTADARLVMFQEDAPRAEPAVADLGKRKTLPTDTPSGQGLPAFSPENQATAGFGLIIGETSPTAIAELLSRTKLSWTAMVRGQDAADRLRSALDEAGLLGIRCSVRQWRPDDVLPPYCFRVVLVLGTPTAARPTVSEAWIGQVVDSVRPYGGELWALAVQYLGLEQAIGNSEGDWHRTGKTAGWRGYSRGGALPGSGSWTHESCDAANTRVSGESRVALPLGTLWYGGPTNEKVLPRHGHGPTPHVVAGRIIMEGPDLLRAIDVYSGVLLWEANFPGIGEFYNTTSHHPGAGAVGSNYVSTPDRIYVLYRRACHVLDAASGKEMARWELPHDSTEKPAHWGWAACRGDLLIATGQPVAPLTESPSQANDGDDVAYAEGSRFLYVLNRKTGEVKWSREARFNFRHNAIAVSDDTVFCIDGITSARKAQLARRGEPLDGRPELYALDLATGRVRWKTNQDVFGTWLAYFEPRNVLLEAGSRNRDRARDEAGRGMTLYDAATGQPLWHHDHVYAGPPLLHESRIIAQGQAFDWEDGRPSQRRDAVTGAPSDWLFRRGYGCDSAIGCQNLLTFRSAAAGFYDLAHDGGTGNFGGFRTSCTATLIPADGVIASPDFTRTCVCSYQQRTSLALVRMPELDYWTYAGTRKLQGDRIRRLGVNFGAPGDRREADGTLWLEYPSVGGDSPEVGVQVSGDGVRYYRHHPLLFEGEKDWVVASGVEGVSKVSLPLATKDQGASTRAAVYEVELWFAEPTDRHGSAPRRFSLRVNGETIAEGIDVRERASGLRRPVRISAGQHRLRDRLTIELVRDADSEAPPLLCGIKLWLADEQAAGD